MLKFILIAIAVVIAGLLIYAATQPDTFRIQRTVIIKATPEKIFPLINDLHIMQTWSAWEKVDPAMKRAYGGADSGVGATYVWKGNNEIGQGRMEILQSSAPSLVAIKLEFIKPFAAVNTAEYTLTPEGDSTRVTHAMFGPSPYLSKLMGLVCNMDKMVGSKFEQSLADLKTIAEH